MAHNRDLDQVVYMGSDPSTETVRLTLTEVGYIIDALRYAIDDHPNSPDNSALQCVFKTHLNITFHVDDFDMVCAALDPEIIKTNFNNIELLNTLQKGNG